MERLAEPPITFDQLNRNAQPYPGHILPEGGTGLALFSAGFHGWNDVIHMARKQMTVDCVDTDTDKLFAMAQVYPTGWSFRVQDAWQFAYDHVGYMHWDVVTVDPFTNDAPRALETLDLWCGLATELVTLTVLVGAGVEIPDGWESDIFPRSRRASWLVLRR